LIKSPLAPPTLSLVTRHSVSTNSAAWSPSPLARSSSGTGVNHRGGQPSTRATVSPRQQLVELGLPFHLGVSKPCPICRGKTTQPLPPRHLRLQLPQGADQRVWTRLAMRSRNDITGGSKLSAQRRPLIMRLTQPGHDV